MPQIHGIARTNRPAALPRDRGGGQAPALRDLAKSVRKFAPNRANAVDHSARNGSITVGNTSRSTYARGV